MAQQHASKNWSEDASAELQQASKNWGAANKTLKYNGLYLEDVANFHSLEKILPIIKEKMNENRMTVLGGLTPNEKYENKTVADVFGKIHFQFTKQDRLKINKEINCCKLIQNL